LGGTFPGLIKNPQPDNDTWQRTNIFHANFLGYTNNIGYRQNNSEIVDIGELTKWYITAFTDQIVKNLIVIDGAFLYFEFFPLFMSAVKKGMYNLYNATDFESFARLSVKIFLDGFVEFYRQQHKLVVIHFDSSNMYDLFGGIKKKPSALYLNRGGDSLLQFNYSPPYRSKFYNIFEEFGKQSQYKNHIKARNIISEGDETGFKVDAHEWTAVSPDGDLLTSPSPKGEGFHQPN